VLSARSWWSRLAKPALWGIHDKYLSREKTLLPALPRRF
jgi:hypothetical protein